MTVRKFPLWLVIPALGLLVAIVLHWLKPRPEPRPPVAAAPLQVHIQPLVQADMALPVFSQGTLMPRREIDLVAEVSGKVVWTAPQFAAGGHLGANEPLVHLEPDNYEVAEIRARARVADAEQLLASEKGRALQAKREWRDLGNEDANQLFLRKPQLAAAEAQLASAKADLKQAQLDMARTRIAAPFSGRIAETHVNLGQYVTPGTRLARVFDNGIIEVRLPVTDQQAALLDLKLGLSADQTPGPAVALTGTVAGRSISWLGAITRTEASLDTTTRMYHAVAEINTADYPEQPPIVGLFVQAKIAGKTLTQVAELPRAALVRGDSLWYLDAESRARQLQVQPLAVNDGKVWLQLPLDPGTLIVLNRQGYLQPGMIVAGVHP